MRAILAASATTTAFGCVRDSRRRNQAPNLPAVLARCGMTARAPWISILRRYLLPRLVMPRSLGLPPVVDWRGTSPSQAAMSRPRAPAREGRRVADGGSERGGVDRAHARNRSETPGRVIGARVGGELLVE